MPFVSYVYGIVPSTAELPDPPAGLEDLPVVVEREGSVAALLSSVPADVYANATLEEQTADLEWISERAIAHDRVLSWASDRVPVVPLPMFSGLFHSTDSVRAVLRDKEGPLTAALSRVADGREYSLRVFRVDTQLRRALPELSPALAELAAAAASAPPGQRYLLERKLDERSRGEVKAVGHRVATEVADTLAGHALARIISPIPPAAAGAPGVMILNAAFLIAPPALTAYQHALTTLVERYEASGFRFAFTGPWPPYNFVNMDTDDNR